MPDAPEHRPGETLPRPLFNGNQRVEPDLQPWPNGVTLTVRGRKPQVSVRFPQGKIAFAAGDVKLGEAKMFLDGQVMVTRLPSTSQFRLAAPANEPIRCRTIIPRSGSATRPASSISPGSLIRRKRTACCSPSARGRTATGRSRRKWPGRASTSASPLASTHGDTPAGSSGRSQHADQQLGPVRPLLSRTANSANEVRLTDDAGPDIWHRMTTDKRGRAWLVWQGFRDGQSDIFARCVDGDGWHDPIQRQHGQGQRLESGGRRRSEGGSRLGRLGHL